MWLKSTPNLPIFNNFSHKSNVDVQYWGKLGFLDATSPISFMQTFYTVRINHPVYSTLEEFL